MTGFLGLRNIHGYHRFFDDLTEYDDLPQSCAGCRNIFGMECRMGQCVPVEDQARFVESNGVNRMLNADVPQTLESTFGFHEIPNDRPEMQIGDTFQSHIIDIRTRDDALKKTPVSRLQRPRRSVRNPSRVIFPGDNVEFYNPAFNLTEMYKNTYVLNGVYDERNWVFIQVKVIYARFLKQQHLNSPYKYQQATYEKCAGTNANEANVWVETEGINYSGKYKNILHFINNNYATTSNTVLVGVKNPQNESVDAYVTAHDTCGRACIPLCYDTNAHPPVYGHCSGAIRVTKDVPTMFTEEENAQKRKPMISSVIFMCDLSLSWPWRQYL